MKTLLTFASTIHDPENRLAYLIDEVGEDLRNTFASAHVAYTLWTHPNIVKNLRERGARVKRSNIYVFNK